MEETAHATVTLTDSTFEAEIEQFEGVALVDFWAAWCGPCMVMAPRLEELAEQFKDNPKVKIAKLNVDEEQKTSEKYRILSLPTFKIFVNGTVTTQVSGVQPKEAFAKVIEQSLATLSAEPAQHAA